MEKAAQETLLRNRHAKQTRLALILVLILSAGLVYLGIRGQNAHEASGFSSESGFQAVSQLTGDVENAWSIIRPQVEGLDAAQKLPFEQAVHALVVRAWESQKQGAGADAEALLSSAGEGDRFPLTMKMLYTAYLVNGPKVGAGDRKSMAALSGNEADAFRSQLLACVTDTGAKVPAPAAKPADATSSTKTSSTAPSPRLTRRRSIPRASARSSRRASQHARRSRSPKPPPSCA